MLVTKSRTAPKQSPHTHKHHTNTFMSIFYKLNYKLFVQRNKKSLSREASHLKCTASSNSFICVERGADVFGEKLADSLFDSWTSRGSSNYLHSIDVITAQLCNTINPGELNGFPSSYGVQTLNLRAWSFICKVWILNQDTNAYYGALQCVGGSVELRDRQQPAAQSLGSSGVVSRGRTRAYGEVNTWSHTKFCFDDAVLSAEGEARGVFFKTLRIKKWIYCYFNLSQQWAKEVTSCTN